MLSGANPLARAPAINAPSWTDRSFTDIRRCGAVSLVDTGS